jgi:hypothetical protein
MKVENEEEHTSSFLPVHIPDQDLFRGLLLAS